MKALLESLEHGSNAWALAQSLGPQRLPAHIAVKVPCYRKCLMGFCEREKGDGHQCEQPWQ